MQKKTQKMQNNGISHFTLVYRQYCFIAL